jgi:hypothetical protein
MGVGLCSCCNPGVTFDDNIEVTSNNEEEEDYGQIQNIEVETIEAAEEEILEHDSMAGGKATLASISGVPKFNTFRMRGVLQG